MSRKKSERVRMAVIGCGRRAKTVLELFRTLEASVVVTGVVDPNVERVRYELGASGFDVDLVRFYPDAETLLQDADQFDGVMIGTRCHLHTQLALKVAETDLPLYLEKPVAITHEQLSALRAAFTGKENNVVVSFPLRLTPVFQSVLEIIQSDRLGWINQVQAVNNVSYGGCYFGIWHRNWEQGGGLWLQKATHDFDCINALVATRPQRIAAVESHLIYGGDMPHDLCCSECDQGATCEESPENIARRGDAGGMDWCVELEGENNHWCAFSKEIRNQDAGSALIVYNNGVHANYTQNFISRLSAGRRGATVIGYSGTLIFDFGGNIQVIEHHNRRVDNIKVEATGSHGGGDEVLAQNYLNLVRGEAESLTPLDEGILSASMCLAARSSAEFGSFVEIDA